MLVTQSFTRTGSVESIEDYSLKVVFITALPLEDFLKKEFTSLNKHKKLDIGIVDMLDGFYKEFFDTNVTQGENPVDAMYASMSFASFFPPADVLESSWFDGSTVNKCTDLGFKNEKIVVDVIMTSNANLKDVQAED